MAGHHGASVTTIDENAPLPEPDMAAHEATFEAFVGLTKWTIVFVVLLLIGMAVFLL